MGAEGSAAELAAGAAVEVEGVGVRGLGGGFGFGGVAYDCAVVFVRFGAGDIVYGGAEMEELGWED